LADRAAVGPMTTASGTYMSGRYMSWRREAPVSGETQREARERIRRNREARDAASAYNARRCVRCGHVSAHVTHATNPAEEPEGLAYYEGMTFCAFEAAP